MSRRLVGVWLIALSLSVVACGFKEAFEDIQRVRTDLKTELGVDAKVACNTKNGRTSVTVRLASPPSGDAAEAKRRITDIVNRNFRRKVETIHVEF